MAPLCCVAVIFCGSSKGGLCDNSEPVGVALLRNKDIAEPGRGLGLGLGGASLALVQSLSSSVATSSKPNATLSRSLGWTPLPVMVAAVSSLDPVWVKSSSSGPRVANRIVLDFVWVSALLGVRPAARTFLRALSPMQSTSWRMASRSETARRRAVRVRRSVLAHGMAPMPRLGVTNPLATMAGV